jgi:hypothetical protein
MIGIATEAVNQRAGFAHPIGVSPVTFCTAAGARRVMRLVSRIERVAETAARVVLSYGRRW